MDTVPKITEAGAVPPPTAIRVWDQVLNAVRDLLSPQAFNTWLRPTRQESFEAGRLRVLVPTEPFKDWIEKSYLPQIKSAMTRIGGVSTIEFIFPGPGPVQLRAPDVMGQYDAAIPARRSATDADYRAHDYTTFRTSSGLIDKKHRRRIGSAIWEFFWCIDRQTGPHGLVLGGKPVTLAEMARPYGVSRRLVGRSLEKLERHGYLEITRTRTGLVIRVVNQKKFGHRKKGGI